MNINELTDRELFNIISTDKYDSELFAQADKLRREYYGKDVYIRGLIEISNICKNDCLYCGIRRGNCNAERYRLSREEILSRCEAGYELGFRTFVMQGGEDPYFTDSLVCEIVSEIKNRFPDCAVTLSLGEKERESYAKYKAAGADRYLLRHETANEEHYKKLHPCEMSLKHRMDCLFNLRELGFQTGSGFMVGSPYQKTEYLVEDLRFLQKLRPQMIGIGPFIPHKDTPFRDFAGGTFELTLRMVALLRLMFPYALIPATTALGTIHPQGRELGLKAGANVIMPNLSPVNVRKLYTLYNNKLCSDAEAAEGLQELNERVKNAGYEIVCSRGDVKQC